MTRRWERNGGRLHLPTGAAILNGLDLSPRPIFQSYSAYTPALEQLNLRAYQSGRAPDFFLWGDDRVDDRYPGQDDALLIAALPPHYEPLFPEGGFWLLKRASALSGAEPERRLIFNTGCGSPTRLCCRPARPGDLAAGGRGGERARPSLLILFCFINTKAATEQGL